MNSWGSDEYIDLFNEIALNSDPSLPPDSCPFNHLHPNIELEILKQLRLFKDYRNLAFTCKKWYQTATSAPRSVKPILRITRLDLGNGCLVMLSRTQYFDHNVDLFKLVNKVKCHSLEIQAKVSRDVQRFILANRSVFEFYSIFISKDHFDHYRMDEEAYLLMEPLFDLCSRVSWFCDWTNEKFLLRFLQNTFSSKSIEIFFSENTEYISIVLKQWINGDRPNMEYFSLSLGRSRRNPFPWNRFTRGVEEFVQDRRSHFDDFSGRFVVPDLPDLTMTGGIGYHEDDSMDQFISFKRVGVAHFYP